MKGGLRTRYQALSVRLSKRQYSGNTAHISDSPNNDRSSGFTIVEVMVVLAVTGVLFISAALAISGRTNKTQFQQSINDVVTMLSQSINSTSIGYYPNASNFACKNSSNSLVITGGANKQGTNNDCIFLGKATQFGVNGTDPQLTATFPIAALREDASGNEVQSLATAKPAVIYPSSAQTNAPNDVTTDPLLYGLTVSSMYYNNNPSNKIGAFAIITDLSRYSYSNSQLQSGSQQMILVPIINTNLNSSIATMAGAINTNLISSVAATSGVQICLNSGTTNQSGLVTIGGSGSQQLTVSVIIKAAPGC
ncbi:MAG: prepilin-type N-terminal cleavage/methylation domain-containing protein [Candidatus Saccharibacteria bacterium]